MARQMPARVTVTRSFSEDRPWALCWAAPNFIDWRLYASREDAMDAARDISVAGFEGDNDFSIAIARLPHPELSTITLEAGIEIADAMLADILANKAR